MRLYVLPRSKHIGHWPVGCPYFGIGVVGMGWVGGEGTVESNEFVTVNGGRENGICVKPLALRQTQKWVFAPTRCGSD